MLQKLFDPDNAFFRPLGKLVDVLVLSALWFVISIPVFTLGPATCALYDVCVKCVRGGESSPYGRFFVVFRREFKTGALCSVICAASGLILARGYEILRFLVAQNPSDGFTAAMFFAYYILLILPIGVFCYLFPVLSRFTLGVGGVFGASFKLAVKHLPSTIVMALAAVECAALCLRYVFPVFVLPAAVALVWSLFLERIFKPFLPQTGGENSLDGNGPTL